MTTAVETSEQGTVVSCEVGSWVGEFIILIHYRKVVSRASAVLRQMIAVNEFHHVSVNPDNKLGNHLAEFMTRDKTHIVAMTGSYFRGDAEAVMSPEDESKFETVSYTYYEQLNGYEYLKSGCACTHRSHWVSSLMGRKNVSLFVSCATNQPDRRTRQNAS